MGAARRALSAAALTAVAALVLAPVLAGLAVTLAMSAGHLPALGLSGPDAGPWLRLGAQPGLAQAVALTLWTGGAAAALSLALAFAAAPALHGSRAARLLAPLIGAPHAALAVGFAFLVAPWGWLARLFSPWATGWDVPPDWPTVNDPLGLALIAGLVLKEAPFLTFVLLAALAQRPVARDLAAARALGYGPRAAWRLAVLPACWPAVRLPVMIVLAYALSAVDPALILGPTLPPTLPVLTLRWFAAGETAMVLPGAAAAVAQALLVAAAILGFLGAERLWRARLAAQAARGDRGRPGRPGRGAALVVALPAAGAFAALALWSVAGRWPFPAALPATWSAEAWGGGQGLWRAAAATAGIGALSVALALALAILWLQLAGPLARAAEAAMALPLIVPPTAFAFGLAVALLRIGLDPGWPAVVAGHLAFVFPYVLIVLAGPWRAFDPALLRAAAAVGAGPVRRLAAVRLPVMLRPLCTAAAVGFAVSASQYLPTLTLGGGRVRTLTTEAVALASGGDRRVAAAFGLLAAALPVAVYLTAQALPGAVWRNRRALRGSP